MYTIKGLYYYLVGIFYLLIFLEHTLVLYFSSIYQKKNSSEKNLRLEDFGGELLGFKRRTFA